MIPGMREPGREHRERRDEKEICPARDRRGRGVETARHVADEVGRAPARQDRREHAGVARSPEEPRIDSGEGVAVEHDALAVPVDVHLAEADAQVEREGRGREDVVRRRAESDVVDAAPRRHERRDDGEHQRAHDGIQRPKRPRGTRELRCTTAPGTEPARPSRTRAVSE
jgi:hypothetical protein